MINARSRAEEVPPYPGDDLFWVRRGSVYLDILDSEIGVVKEYGETIWTRVSATVDVAYEALGRAGRIMSQLRSLHRGPLVEKKETTDLSGLVEESLVLMRKKAAAQDIELVGTPGNDLVQIELESTDRGTTVAAWRPA